MSCLLLDVTPTSSSIHPLLIKSTETGNVLSSNATNFNLLSLLPYCTRVQVGSMLVSTHMGTSLRAANESEPGWYKDLPDIMSC